MTTNFNLEKDLNEASKMAAGLEEYVRQDELYGNIGGGFFGGSNMPKLTVGALLMRLRRLDALREQMTQDQQAKLDEAKAALAHVRKEWNLHYEEKVTREAKSRLDAMQSFFRECAESKSLCASIYKPEIMRRTIVQELLREMTAQNIQSKDVDERVKDVDGKLRGHIVKTDFQWSSELTTIYPRDEFWWLYGQPPVPEGQ